MDGHFPFGGSPYPSQGLPINQHSNLQRTSDFRSGNRNMASYTPRNLGSFPFPNTHQFTQEGLQHSMGSRTDSFNSYLSEPKLRTHLINAYPGFLNSQKRAPIRNRNIFSNPQFTMGASASSKTASTSRADFTAYFSDIDEFNPQRPVGQFAQASTHTQNQELINLFCARQRLLSQHAHTQELALSSQSYLSPYSGRPMFNLGLPSASANANTNTNTANLTHPNICREEIPYLTGNLSHEKAPIHQTAGSSSLANSSLNLLQEYQPVSMNSSLTHRENSTFPPLLQMKPQSLPVGPKSNLDAQNFANSQVFENHSQPRSYSPGKTRGRGRGRGRGKGKSRGDASIPNRGGSRGKASGTKGNNGHKSKLSSSEWKLSENSMRPPNPSTDTSTDTNMQWMQGYSTNLSPFQPQLPVIPEQPLLCPESYPQEIQSVIVPVLILIVVCADLFAPPLPPILTGTRQDTESWPQFDRAKMIWKQHGLQLTNCTLCTTPSDNKSKLFDLFQQKPILNAEVSSWNMGDKDRVCNCTSIWKVLDGAGTLLASLHAASLSVEERKHSPSRKMEAQSSESLNSRAESQDLHRFRKLREAWLCVTKLASFKICVLLSLEPSDTAQATRFADPQFREAIEALEMTNAQIIQWHILSELRKVLSKENSSTLTCLLQWRTEWWENPGCIVFALHTTMDICTSLVDSLVVLNENYQEMRKKRRKNTDSGIPIECAGGSS